MTQFNSINEANLNEVAGGGKVGGDAITHVVASGETLSSIAVRYNTTVSKIAELNKIVNVNNITVGQRLVIIPGLK